MTNTRKIVVIAATAVILPMTWASPASANLPDKKSDRAGWIKASMQGSQARFCGPLPAKKLRGGSDPDYVRKQVEKKWQGVKMLEVKFDQALFLANALCKFPGNPDLQRALMQLWKKWTKLYGLGRADWADFAATQDPKYKKLPWSSFGPKDTRFADVDAATQAVVAKELLVTSYGMDFMSYAEMLDSAANPSEHLKVAFVSKCLDGYKGSIARWAICKADALSLDRKRFNKELKTAKINPDARLKAKMGFVRLQHAAAARAAQYRADAARDDGVKKVVDTIPAAALKRWAAESAPHKALLEWSYKIVDDARANNKKLMNGCEDQLRDHLASYLKEKNPRTSDDLKNAFRDNIGSQLANAAALCLVRNKVAQKYWATMSSGFAEYWGPRTMTWHALVAEKIEFDTNRGRDPLGLPKPVTLYANASQGSSSGIIAKVKDSGDTVDITFKKAKWTERVCKKWKESNRVDGIDLQSGKIIYRSYCAKYGTEKRSSTPSPVTVDKAYASGLKNGLHATFTRGRGGKGYPIAIFASKKRTKIVGAFGVLY